MNIKEVVRALKTDIHVGDWRAGHIPRTTFPLSHVREKHYKLGQEYRWRIVTFDCLQHRFRLLVVFNEGKQIYRTTLATEVERDLIANTSFMHRNRGGIATLHSAKLMDCRWA